MRFACFAETDESATTEASFATSTEAVRNDISIVSIFTQTGAIRMTRTREEKEEIYVQTMYGDGNGNVEIPPAPTTQREKIHVASKTTLLRAGKIAALSAAIKAHQTREKKTIEPKKLTRWENTEPHSTEAPLAGRRGKKSRRQRKSVR